MVKSWDSGDFPGGPVVKNLPARAEEEGSTLGQNDPTRRRAGQPVPPP